MATLLQPVSLLDKLHQQIIDPPAVLSLLASYDLVPRLLSEHIIDQAIASIHCELDVIELACNTFYQQRKLNSEAEKIAWRSRYGWTAEHVEAIATRPIKLNQLIETTWGNKLSTDFLKHKHNLDQVIYSLICTSDREIVNELYFRICEGEQSFADLAPIYSEGVEAKTSGLFGPFEFGRLQPELANFLYTAPIGEVQPPKAFGQMYAIIRVEQRLPAQLDEAMRQRLLSENFNTWLQAQLGQLPQLDQCWMAVNPQL